MAAAMMLVNRAIWSGFLKQNTGEQSGLVFFCHGARDPSWREPFDAIVAQVRNDRPAQRVALGFLELMTPTFDEAVAELVGQGVSVVRIVPLFLAPGKHTRVDLPALIERARQQWPAVDFSVVPTLTEIPTVRTAIIEWALRGADQ